MHHVIVSLCVLLVLFFATSSTSPLPVETIENTTTENPDLDTEGKEYGEEGGNGGEIQMTRAYMTGAHLWPGGKVIYEIDLSLRESMAIAGIHIAARSISEATCVKFINRTKENSRQPYLQFFRLTEDMKRGCKSSVGFKNQYPQRVTVTPMECDNHPDNYAGSVVHELIHTLGFVHEFQRTDRDGYVKYTGNLTGKDYNEDIAIIQKSDTRGIPFNFKSIMQYDPGVGFKEVKPRPPGFPAPIGTFANMGQECEISKGDIDLINSVYADECKLAKPVKPAIVDYRIKGTDCNHKIKAMKDMIMKIRHKSSMET